MFIKDLQPRQTNVDVEGVVEEMSDVREFSKFGRSGRVATAFMKDGTGKVKLSLWNEQIDQVKVGDTVKVLKGYVSEFQGELQLTTGKFGTLEIVNSEGGDAPTETTAEAKPEPDTPAPAEAPKPEPTPAPEPTPQPKAEEPKKEAIPDPTLDVEEEDLS